MFAPLSSMGSGVPEKTWVARHCCQKAAHSAALSHMRTKGKGQIKLTQQHALSLNTW